ncbi:MXAN_6640 family putative metalloprotease [Nocardioides ochotonae]|uniref:MXAN_6640 family putative metalloprotease n=1 Tax=Nocardioides ochotonae TaxID=2685869 RepID=UPI001409B224|nr:MXAN_6640 family putative metalloprotease [Nocardioides ochotonae]
MRRTAAAVLVALSTAFTVLPAALPTASAAASAHSDEPQPLGEHAAGGAPVTTPEAAQAALEGATELAAGTASEAERAEATLILRDLAVSLPLLRGDDRARAEAILARPTHGASDPYGNGYTVGSKRMCKANVCVHWVTSTSDAVTNRAWVKTNLKVLNNVWRKNVKMGYRTPVSDRRVAGNNGGNGKFDVYLSNIGGRGQYGYCVPEAYGRRVGSASSYCVMDNDFAEFGGSPKGNLKVTAAHELFHAVQFAYDFTEDRWFMESTATWMEERFADGVNDNRQYLRNSQIVRPSLALDTFSMTGSTQYASWIFWEYLGTRFGHSIVRQVWERAAPGRRTDPYSTKAIAAALQRKGGFAQVFRAYSAANARPAASYAEGKAWPKPTIAGRYTLARKASKDVTPRLDHLTAQHYVVKPAKSLKAKKWKLRITVDGPNKATAPGAYVYVNRKKGGSGTAIRLNRKGKGSTTIAFNRRNVRSVTVTLANGSTRYRGCQTSSTAPSVYSCNGSPRDENRPFRLTLRTLKG